MRNVGNNFQVILKKGQSLEATVPKLESISLAPVNVAEPVNVRVNGEVRTVNATKE